MDISIILPSHNKYPLNIFTLHSLCNQNFDLSRMEVIMIDDASEDQTSSVLKMNFPFHFRYIRTDSNVGRSRVRNIGIDEAKGNVILFLDAENIVEPDFVQNHYRHHIEREDLVITGAYSQKGLYSTLFPDFTNRQIQHFYSIIRNQPRLLAKWRLNPEKHQFNLRKVRTLKEIINHPYPLITKRFVKKRLFSSLSFAIPLFRDVLEQYGNHFKDYQLPWQAFLSGNVSLTKTLLSKAGYFDEDYRGWGFEDTDMGYRLHRQGGIFIHDPETFNYHQEHPYQAWQRIQHMFSNYHRYQLKHSTFETCSHILTLAGLCSRIEESNLIAEYKKLLAEHPGKYTCFLDTLLYMLKELGARHANASSMKDSVGYLSIEQLGKALSEKRELEATNLYPLLVSKFTLLRKLIRK